MDIAEEIQKLQDLHRNGALTDEEFAQAKAAVLAGGAQPGEEDAAGAKCYRCDAAPDRTCTLCGHLFCRRHGGERWVWVARDGSKYGARNNLTKRVICDACTPDPTVLKVSVAFAVVFLIVVLVIIFSLWASFPHF